MAHVSVPMRSERCPSHAPQHPLSPHLWHENRTRKAGEDGGGVVPPQEEPAAVDRVCGGGAAQRPELGEDPSPWKNGLGSRFN